MSKCDKYLLVIWSRGETFPWDVHSEEVKDVLFCFRGVGICEDLLLKSFRDPLGDADFVFQESPEIGIWRRVVVFNTLDLDVEISLGDVDKSVTLVSILTVLKVTLSLLVLRLTKWVSLLSWSSYSELMDALSLLFLVEPCILFRTVLGEPFDSTHAPIIIYKTFFLKLICIRVEAVILQVLMSIEVDIVASILDQW